ncbi:glycosyltransferase [Vibrio alginolyticus]|uniref:glycosyltransferase n=1 Tax=Vibrio alginolyticus TaxID=663 RepID=UPI00215C395D|nr:glycosyltransferase [Vibrio alginolyticus]MCR9489751.1 glycosyltransferase [Vibrio alginolyticus]
MKVTILTTYYKLGGASIAATRLFYALNMTKTETILRVGYDKEKEFSNVVSSFSFIERIFNKIKYDFYHFMEKLFSYNDEFHSPNFLPTTILKKINADDIDVLNIHWVNAGLISLEQISRINKPVVLTMHDLWPICADEHYVDDFGRSPYSTLNSKVNLSPYKKFLLNRKVKAFKNVKHIVVPSKWVMSQVINSKVLSGISTTVIPNVLHEEFFKKKNREELRYHEGLSNKKVIGFGAIGGAKDKRKGFDLLLASLSHVLCKDHKCSVIIFGQDAPEVLPIELEGFDVLYTGNVDSVVKMSEYYHMMDVMIVPSRLETFGQTASEAIATGTPVVAFNTSGLRDVISHNETGYLARCFDVQDLANGIQHYLNLSDNDISSVRRKCNEFAYENWRPEKISNSYNTVYQKVISS